MFWGSFSLFLAQFKDYDSTPIGFGVAVFCLAGERAPGRADLYARFYAAFRPHGEACIPVDAALVASGAFAALLARLHAHAAAHHRDCWAQCGACGRWRVVGAGVAAELEEADAWECAMLRCAGEGWGVGGGGVAQSSGCQRLGCCCGRARGAVVGRCTRRASADVCRPRLRPGLPPAARRTAAA
jgi:hypothetical protein